MKIDNAILKVTYGVFPSHIINTNRIDLLEIEEGFRR